MPFRIIRNDITKVKSDAIVNAANTKLQCGGGVCGSIFKAAGALKLQKECDEAGFCDVGQAVITKGYDLPAKYIIHTVGPVWCGGGKGEEELLSACYTNSLEPAESMNLESVAFPLISSGTYGFPREKALNIAVTAISNFLDKNEITVTLVVFDKSSFIIGENLFKSITEYIDDNYVEKYGISRNINNFLPSRIKQKNDGMCFVPCCEDNFNESVRSLAELVKHKDETFSQMLLRLIDEKGKNDVEIYKKANIDRKLFSKIKSKTDYVPSKRTAIAFSIALELTLDETKDLLIKAGYALSRSSKFDIIVSYFIDNGNYNIFEINKALFSFDQSLLGA